jgi:hypothetical protein
MPSQIDEAKIESDEEGTYLVLVGDFDESIDDYDIYDGDRLRFKLPDHVVMQQLYNHLGRVLGH